MAEEPTRKLAVLLHADVVDSTSLVRVDETLAHQRIQDAFRRFSETIATHRGVAHEIRGDALVAEFPTASEAVSASLAFQDANSAYNDALGDDVLPAVRVGIAMGEVVVANGTITGEGVVLAQRLEQLAEPGGVCLQDAAYQTLPKRLPFDYKNLGEKELKGFDEPVRVFAVSHRSRALGSESDQPSRAGIATTNVPDKPSIAVLPFTNMSRDPDQEYFSDGITEDIITELSRFPVLFVIARHSSFTFKGEKADIREVGRKLGAQYVVEGSVRRAGNRVRITVQLIEAETGNHVWAERYDRELEDIFAVQDEVTRSIVGVLPGRLQDAVAERASRKRPDNMKAYELLLKGKSLRDSFSAEDTAKARPFFEKAIELDPRYAKAHAYLADTYVVDLILGLGTAETSRTSLQHARKAVALDSSDIGNQDQLGFAYICEGMWEDAEVQFEKTLSLVMNEAESMAWIGYAILMMGRPEQARDIVLAAKRLDPLHPPSFDWALGQACYFAKRYEEVVRVLTGRALLNSFAYACVAGAHAYLDRVDQAHAALEMFLKERRGEFSSRNMVVEGDNISVLADGYRRMWRRKEDWDHFVYGLRKAGLPD